MLEISQLSKSYDDNIALDGVSLSIDKGMFGLLGPNGAGKSSLIRTIATLQQPDSGFVVFDGVDVSKQPQKIRARLGYLPQDFDVYPHVSALHLLDHMAILKGIGDDAARKVAVERLLVETNLWAFRKKAVSKFSGGMKQRFGIALALIGDPDLIIVDEPTAGLDPEERHRFLNLLANISENKVVILSTHIVEDVEELCSKMAILADGKICLSGEPDCIVNNLQGKLWAKTVTKETLAEHQDRYNVISTHLKAAKNIIHVVAEQQPDESFTAISPGLKDAYFATLKQA